LETLALLDALRALPLDIVIISASHEDLARAGAAHLGFVPEQVHGMRPKQDERGRYRPEMERSTYGPGKVEILREKWGGRPLLAAGDSVAGTDRELLAAALLPVAVNPRGAHHEAALAHPSMRVLHARPNPKEAPA
jgi:phosphoserine phosphatase